MINHCRTMFNVINIIIVNVSFILFIACVTLLNPQNVRNCVTNMPV